jgi:phage shock protein A
MKKPTLKSLEKRIAELEARLAQLEPRRSKGMAWKHWRAAVGTMKRTDIAEAIDEAGRKIRQADRRKTGS